MPPFEKLTAQLKAAREQLAGDLEHLASLHGSLQNTAETIERARRAYEDSLRLLEHLGSMQSPNVQTNRSGCA